MKTDDKLVVPLGFATIVAVCAVACAILIGGFLGLGEGIEEGWKGAYRSMKAGTIEKEIQQRAPGLWIELNSKEGKP